MHLLDRAIDQGADRGAPPTDGDARGDRRVNAKSIMGVMMLAAGQGSTVLMRIDGEDEAVAMAAVIDLFTRNFDEGG